MKNNRPPIQGYFFVVLAAAFWAGSGSAAKFLFQSGVTPFELVQLRTTIASSVLLLWFLIKKRSLLRIHREDIAYFSLLGGALAASQFTYLYAISRIQVAAAILLQYQAPVLIAISAVVFARKRLSHFTIAAIAGAVTGCYLMVGGYNLDMLQMNREGIASGFTSAVAFALYTVKSEYGMRTYTPWTVAWYAMFIAAVIWNIIYPPFAAFNGTYADGTWWWVIFIGIFGTILPFGLYNEGIKIIRSTRASITATLEPVMAGIIAFAFLGEIMEPWQILGAVLVIASILLLQIRQDPE
jgi:drug/metabolite transporter (DMT)-like permease